MFTVSGVAVLLFLGGWHTGFAPVDQLLIDTRYGDAPVWTWIANLVGMVVFIKKASFLVFFQIWLRWTLPRLRIDQVMMICLKYLLPISCVLLLGVTVWPFAINAMTGRSTLIASMPALGESTPDVRLAKAATKEVSGPKPEPTTPSTDEYDPPPIDEESPMKDDGGTADTSPVSGGRS